MALAGYEDLAGIIDHWLVGPELTAGQVVEGLELAQRYRVACATVRPCDIDLAARVLRGSAVKPASVCGFPHGWQNTGVKLYEFRDLLRRGAKEVEWAIATSALLSREFQHVQTELAQAAAMAKQEGVVLKAALETAALSEELKIIACRCLERAEVAFASIPAAMDDLELFRKYLPEEIGVQVRGELDKLDEAIELEAAGCSRMATGATAALLEQWKARLAAARPADG